MSNNDALGIRHPGKSEMYKKFFGLRESPFKVNPDPRYLFLTPGIQEALASLAYGIRGRRGIILLTGEVGTGKTTILNMVLDWLRQNRAATAFIFNTRFTTKELFGCLMADFGIPCESHSKSEILMRLNRWLLDRYTNGQTAVLIIDEAQGLSDQVLEEVRFLTNLETSTEKLLQVVLSGQPELEDKLRQPHLRQLRQRITVRCRTTPLSLEETQGYITERLRIAGATNGPLFSPGAVESIYRYSRGIPRVINVLCEHGLINCFADQQKKVTPDHVEEVAREFELDIIKPTAAPSPRSENSTSVEKVLRDLSTVL
ncbi:MAG TPA: AAA family ATPase, partial [Candidatus Dormibacteraeota bacterium]|nr:AAA family ATPase [Candidatus Dormibacteraeota bacterium]